MASRPRFHLLLALLAAITVLVGIIYYYDQLAATPLLLLIFVPDCPLYMLLGLLVMTKVVKSDAFSFLVSVGMVMYSLWTLFVFALFPAAYFSPQRLIITLIFIAGHLGMFLGGLAILPKKKVAIPVVLITMGWFLLNDVSDYFWGTRPYLPPGHDTLVMALTFAASIIIPLLLCFYWDKAEKVPLVKWMRGIIQ